MAENLKKILLRAKYPKDAVRVATKYGYDTEIKGNGELDEEELNNVSGGRTEEFVTYASYSVVVRDRNTGEILAVVPY